MKIGIVITIHNRPELTRQTLESLKRSKLLDCYIVLVDDASDQETRDIIDEFSILHIQLIKLRHNSKKGVKQSLIWGVSECFRNGCDLVTNLDNDVKLKPEWLLKLLELNQQFPHRILTGFHSTTCNADGSQRHEILQQGPNWATKRSAGGINMMFDERLWNLYILPSLQEDGNWDHHTSIRCMEAGVPIISTVPSVIQHTGLTESSMGHNQEQPDTAADYFERELPDVTLFGLDSLHPDRLKYAAMMSQLEIKFGHVALLHDRAIDSKEKYSEWIIRELHKCFVTSHVLVIQSDGYIVNPGAWDDEWLEWDYIGATWGYKKWNVGNGGFSLRSKRLMEAVSKYAGPCHPEDHVICRMLRPRLEEEGFRFAPEEVANEFSIEAYGCERWDGANAYSGQFGFHGWNVDFGDLPNVPRRPKQYSNKLKKFV